MELILLTLPVHCLKHDWIDTGTEKNGSICKVVFFFFFLYTVVLCIAVGRHLTLCLELKAHEEFQQPQPRFSVILARESCILAEERKTEEGHVEWEKKTLGLVGGSSFSPSFPLCGGALTWERHRLRENIVYDTIYCHMSREKHHHYVTFHHIWQGLSTLSEPGARLRLAGILGSNIDNIKLAY